MIICSLPEITPPIEQVKQSFGNQRRKMWKIRKNHLDETSKEISYLAWIFRTEATGNRAVKKGLETFSNHVRCGRTISLYVSELPDKENSNNVGKSIEIKLLNDVPYDGKDVQLTVDNMKD